MTDSNNNRSGQGDKPTVRGTRRRKSGSTSGQRQRAQAPSRDRRTTSSRRTSGASQQSSQSQPRQTSQPRQATPRPSTPRGSRSAGSGTGPALPINRRTLIILALLAFLVFVIGPMLFGGGDDSGLGLFPDEGLSGPVAVQPTQIPPTRVVATEAPRATAMPFVAPGGDASGDTWLVMLYQDADDKVLEKDIFVDLNEAEMIGSTDNVHIVAQLDRYAGGYSGDGNWTSTKRYYVTQDNDLERVGSQLVQDLGETNMGDGNTLVDFCAWAIDTFPADKYALILSDHGMGWPGGWSDPAPSTGGESGSPMASRLGNHLYLNEMDASLQVIRDRTGIDKLDLVGLDACLMAQLEVFSALSPHAHYAVASEETEPALGWAYTSFLGKLAADPSMSGGALGQAIINSYIHEDRRIVDDQARADLLSRGSFGFSLPSSDQVASQMSQNVTLSAVDLAASDELVKSVNGLCLALQGADQRAVAKARKYTRSYTSVFGQQVPPSYIDLGHFCQLLLQVNAGSNVERAANSVLAGIDQAVIAETHGQGKKGSTGVAIYFPNSQLFQNAITGPPSYTVIAERFAGASLWDDYLAFHYTGRQFDISSTQAVVPDTSAISTPGGGEFAMSAVQVSSEVAAPGSPILLSADITAYNLGHVLLFAGYMDKSANSILVADMDYIEAGDTRQVEGVYYPVWPDGEFTLEFEWEPIVYYIDDGANAVAALLTPVSYGATAEEAVYTVDGVYTFDTGENLRAKLYMLDGELQAVYTFTGDPSASAPREVRPQIGDTFTVGELWYDLDSSGRVVDKAMEAGGTLAFGEDDWVWIEYDAAIGDYVVGFIAEDLDGNRQEAYAQVQVQ